MNMLNIQKELNEFTYSKNNIEENIKENNNKNININNILNKFNITENKDQNKHKIECSKCVNSLIIIENNIHICTGCGEHILYGIDATQDERNYGSNDSRGVDLTRCGSISNPFMVKSSLGTTINKFTTGYNGIKLINNVYLSMPNEERSMYKVCKKIKDICNKGNFLKVVEDDAMNYYKKILCKDEFNDKIITRGINHESIVCSCIYLACKMNDCDRSVKELSAISEIDKKDITNGVAMLYKIMHNRDLQIIVKTSTPLNFLPRYCSILNINEKMEKKIRKVIKRAEKLNLTGTNTPSSVAAGVIYFVYKSIDQLNGYITQDDLIKNCNISVVTLDKIYRVLEPFKQILFQ